MSDGYEGAPGEDRDRTKLVWGLIGAVLVLMVVSLWFMGQPDANKTLVRSRHILVKYDATDPVARQRALKTINELRERIVDGEDFGKLAEEYSDDPGSKVTGGDLGFLDPTDFDGGFKDYVMLAPVGELSGIVSTSHGFHVIEVIERILSEYDQRELEIEQRLREEEGTPAV